MGVCDYNGYSKGKYYCYTTCIGIAMAICVGAL